MNEPQSTGQLLITVLSGVSSLAILSFLWRENPLVRFFEHLFIGIASGLSTILVFKNFFWPTVFQPMLGLDIVTYPDGTTSGQASAFYYLYFLPMAFGCLYYFIYSKRHAWLAKLVIGFSLGTSAGMYFKGFFAEMMPQIISSFKPILVFAEGRLLIGESISNTVFIFTLLSSMYYFFFSFKRTSQTGHAVALGGRWLMMVCFGAFFGSTVMARMAILVERLQFLLNDWTQAITELSIRFVR